ncbi:MAG: hypothetical protein ACFFDT_35930 [Candidatus Hodarchaeota archaeon]
MILGIIIFIVGAMLIILYREFAPYCCTHTCGMTGGCGIEWTLLPFVGVVLLPVGVIVAI